MRNDLGAEEMWVYRRIVFIPWTDIITNAAWHGVLEGTTEGRKRGMKGGKKEGRNDLVICIHHSDKVVSPNFHQHNGPSSINRRNRPNFPIRSGVQILPDAKCQLQ